MLNSLISTLDIKRMRSWGLRGRLAILDQGAFSGSNFILNILLARWLTQEDYGAFSVAFKIVLFLSSFHNAIQLEPMSVIGPANYQENLEEYLHAQIRLNFIITIPIAILFFLAGRILLSTGVIDSRLSQVLVAAGLAMPFIFFLWVVRRTFYVRQQPVGALSSSVLYAFLMMGGLWAARRFGEVDHGQFDQPDEVFGVDGAAPLYRRKMLEDIQIKGQYFDESFFIHKEDVDLAWRARLLGWRCWYTPEAVAVHPRSFRPGQKRDAISPEVRIHSVKNRYLLLKKNESPQGWRRDGLPILWYDLKILFYICFFERSSLRAFGLLRQFWPQASEWRREIWKRVRVDSNEMLRWFK
jgi:hypothetical protein